MATDKASPPFGATAGAAGAPPQGGQGADAAARLRTKIVALAVVPLLITLALVTAVVRYQAHDLAQRERALVEQSYLEQRRSELRSYVELAVSTVRPLYESGRDDPQLREEAMRRLAALDYGSDGYFFVYDLQGRSLMHSRQPELVGQLLWDLRDPQGRPTIQQLIERANAGGGFVEYAWPKPSGGGRLAPKLGYVIALPHWNWMVGTGLYLDDIEATQAGLERQVGANVGATMWWIAGFAALGLGAISACGLLLNLSEHRTAEARMRLLARRVVQSQEEERGHLARELHDGTSQTLVSAKLLIESAVEDIERERPAPATLGTALQHLNEALGEVRRLSHELRPALLDTLGLPAALEHLARAFGEHGPVAAAADVAQPPQPLPRDVTTALFRVAQEALTNVRKHAHARNVHVTLECVGGGVQLEVRDDGRGFDPAALQHDPHRGIGLRNMHERMEAIGGRLQVRSGPGGTRVVAEVPGDRMPSA
ncbi:cache domain-containing protein [Paracidovorax konjaci]|uniref:histidine kinase n=1 Tax=Paracidovorax konjaci TaxID=32040 RepID=A0A1I1VFU1_9BURK|nr:cache domain-containing protein [Paracidovorax konjaci]SFD81739.1 two-component system, NarL family, sensor kinase [Paracidovorax konjaci]